jgi:hypothetical protein
MFFVLLYGLTDGGQWIGTNRLYERKPYLQDDSLCVVFSLIIVDQKVCLPGYEETAKPGIDQVLFRISKKKFLISGKTTGATTMFIANFSKYQHVFLQ